MSIPCGQQVGLSDGDFWKQFSQKVFQRQIPLLGSLALTNRCNLSCVHCYAREASPPARGDELTTEQWRRIIADAKDAGCLHLLLTGGEPLLRDDFPEIYTFAKKSGMMLTVFTNGTLLDQRILELFRELPPHLVEISLYGATSAVHDRITGGPGSFARARHGIESLLALGLKVGLKSVLMTLNAEEMPGIRRLAQSYGTKFRADAAIFPTLAGDRSPLELRVPPELAIAQEFSDPSRAGEWRELLGRFPSGHGSGSLYICGAGINTFYVDPKGFLSPCLMVSKVRYPLSTGNFREGWQEGFAAFRSEAVPPASPCRDCQQKLVCGYCPGFFDMENGEDLVPSDYICSIGKLRYEQIASGSIGG
jgi:radical SAM protein with 4Fe4S-binding SPASM domain